MVVFIKACGGNRREAFNVVVMFWLFCGALLLVLTQTVVQDEAAVQRAVREALEDGAFDPRACVDGDIDVDVGAGSTVLTTHAPRALSPSQESHIESGVHGGGLVGSPVHNPLNTRLLSNASSHSHSLPSLDKPAALQGYESIP